MVRIIHDVEMFIRTLPTSLLQIFGKITLNTKVIVKSIIDPDVNFSKSPLSMSELIRGSGNARLPMHPIGYLSRGLRGKEEAFYGKAPY